MDKKCGVKIIMRTTVVKVKGTDDLDEAQHRKSLHFHFIYNAELELDMELNIYIKYCSLKTILSLENNTLNNHKSKLFMT